MSSGAPEHNLVRLRPRVDTLYISQGRTVLATAPDGFIAGGPDHGLFAYETCLLSRYCYRIAGQLPHPVALSNVEQHSWLGYYILFPPDRDPGAPDAGSGQLQPRSQQTIELRLSRSVCEGIHEDVDLTNFSRQSTSFELTLELATETRGAWQQHGKQRQSWQEIDAGVWELVFEYQAEHHYEIQGHAGTACLHDGLVLRVDSASTPPSYVDGRISFAVELAPQQSWHACVKLIPSIDGQSLSMLYGCRAFRGVENRYDRRREHFLSAATRFSAPGSESLTPVVLRTVEQATRDLAALRLYDLDQDEQAWTMAAGLPLYVALYGRDSLTAAWQAALISPAMMAGSLPALARLQGTQVDDWRDEQPGRMLHEAHSGPLERLSFNPRQRYYGSVTTSGFYPFVVSALWHWTGDQALVRPLLAPALKALAWLDRSGDLDGDGFYEYKTRSLQGVRHQAWKDSPDAIVDEDGADVEPPIATCEEQAFVYIAKLHLCEVLWSLGEKREARRLFREARELKQRFNAAFWMPDAQFLAMGLDAQKRPIRSIGSNAGHCLATAILDRQLVQPLAQRLMAPDLYSGWGIRTLSAQHPAYNPYSYHRGSVWPVEQGTFALGFMRYGLHHYSDQLCRAQFEAAACFDFYRLPEAFSGHQRDAEHPFPALYPQANSPQAWSASTTFCFVQALLGLYPYAPLNLLLVDPRLPAWLPELTLQQLRVGQSTVSIRFYRKRNGASSYRVLDLQGPLRVVRQPSPWSLTASAGERLKDFLLSVIPAP